MHVIKFLILSLFISINSFAKNDFIVVAGGCFWCVEEAFDGKKGIISAVSGYSGGEKKNATYKKVSAGLTFHREVVKVTFDPKIISLEKVLQIFWKTIDPYDEGGQFADRGFHYTTAIYYKDKAQENAAYKSINWFQGVKPAKRKIAVAIEKYKNFFPAEDYHQDYASKNPVRYNLYKTGSGRAKYLKSQWK